MKEFQIGLWFIIKLSINKLLRFKIFTLPYIKNVHGYKKQIFWECGGGYLAYYWGIATAMHELYTPEVCEKLVLSGSSAGSIISFCLKSRENLKTLFSENYLSLCRKLILQPFGGFYNLNSAIKLEYENVINKHPSEVFINKKHNLFSTSLHLNVLCPLFSYISMSYEFENANDLVECALASHGIPFVIGSPKYTILPHPTKWFYYRIDSGFLTMLLGRIYGYQALMPYGEHVSTAVICPSTFRPCNPINLWMWMSPEHNRKLYNLGYTDAMGNLDKLENIIR